MMKLSKLHDGVLIGDRDLKTVVTAGMMKDEVASGKQYEGKYFTLYINGSAQGFTIVEEVEIDVMHDRRTIQIFGDGLRAAFEGTGIPAEMKYETTRELGQFEYHVEVWELTEEDLFKLDTIPDDEWNDRGFGWYRIGERSQYPDGTIHIVNGHEMIGYGMDDERLEMFQDEAQGPAIFKHVLDYIFRGEELSTEKNIAITCTTLAQANNMTLADFMAKYY